MISKDDIQNFEQAIESLRQYRRYELLDDKKRDLLNSVYVDPLDNDAILNLCLKDNTTVLIGRKGTGKSTIFMRMQNELRKKNDIITCYIDVKNIFDNAKRDFESINYIGISDLNDMEIYSLQRKFIIGFITELIREIEKNYNSFWDKVAGRLGKSKPGNALKKLTEIKDRISNNDHLKNVELQVINEVNVTHIKTASEESDVTSGVDLGLKLNNNKVDMDTKVNSSLKYKEGSGLSNQNQYNRVFARIFEITSMIEEIKNILSEMKMKRLYIILDDYSEIDQNALKMFCDLIVNPLNNNSDNFIKLKISAYPGRVELGELDPQKIDIRYLDYYRLYKYDKRSEMESNAISYTKRIIDKRLEVYTGKSMSYFFDTSKASEEDYYKLIFKMSLNVVRHIGLILDYAKDNSLVNGKLITISNLNDAAKIFYEDRLKVFFKESKSTLISYDERVERFQLEHLLNLLIDKSKEIKSNIRSNKLKANIFDNDRNNPYCSHFHVTTEYEELLSSLELNFFISKYNEMSNKSRKKVSIFSFNYGLSLYENVRWGKPEGNEYRTYFIETPFNYNPVIEGFINNTKQIKCTNPECNNVYTLDELPMLEKYNMNCLKCMTPGSVKELPIHGEFGEIANEIGKQTNLLETDQYRFLSIAVSKGSQVTPQEMAQELDTSVSKIGWLTKKLDEKYNYLDKIRAKGSVKYYITELGKEAVS